MILYCTVYCTYWKLRFYTVLYTVLIGNLLYFNHSLCYRKIVFNHA